jgi:hypothetical protein
MTVTSATPTAARYARLPVNLAANCR